MYGLPYPEFMLEKSWDELRNFDGLHGKEDLIYGQRGLIKANRTSDTQKFFSNSLSPQ